MSTKRTSRSAKKPVQSSMMFRLDKDSKALLKEAADLRGMSVSAYVRSVTVAQARREVQDAQSYVFRMSPEGQLAFWNALQEEPVLTDAQRELGAIMRGEK